MKALFALLLVSSFVVYGEEDHEDGDYQSRFEHYGRPTLYYSEEGIRQRKELELMRESNELQKERLELERERLRNEYSIGRYKR